jgi:hypothetical protein
MSTATEEAKRIRATYKKLGWSSRMVSVRSEYFSMGSAVNVTIKDPRVNAEKAKSIAEESERIHRCEVTGEILGGGNQYVSVTHSSECRDAMAAPWIEPLRAALAEIPKGDYTRHATVEGAGDATVAFDHAGMAAIWHDGRHGMCFHPECGLTGGAFDLALHYGKPKTAVSKEAQRARIAELKSQLAQLREEGAK